MNLEDNEPGSEHIVEIPGPPRRVLNVRRRSYPVLIAAACLGLGGILVGVFVVGRQRASDEHLTSDALQREELRDGWKALGAAAAVDAQTARAPAAPVAPPASVLIVNVPGQLGPQGPQGTPGAPGSPGVPGQTVVVGSPGTSYGVPVTGSVTGGPQQSPVSGVVPSGAVGQVAGTANIPGSTSNPALPGNNGSAFPSPGSTGQRPAASGDRTPIPHERLAQHPQSDLERTERHIQFTDWFSCRAACPKCDRGSLRHAHCTARRGIGRPNGVAVGAELVNLPTAGGHESISDCQDHANYRLT
jgi:hypothetical protein